MATAGTNEQRYGAQCTLDASRLRTECNLPQYAMAFQPALNLTNQYDNRHSHYAGYLIVLAVSVCYTFINVGVEW